MINKKVWYLEYSKSQKSYHVETMKSIIDLNLTMLKKGLKPSYVIIDGPGTLKEMLDSSDKLKLEIGRP